LRACLVADFRLQPCVKEPRTSVIWVFGVFKRSLDQFSILSWFFQSGFIQPGPTLSACHCERVLSSEKSAIRPCRNLRIPSSFFTPFSRNGHHRHVQEGCYSQFLMGKKKGASKIKLESSVHVLKSMNRKYRKELFLEDVFF